MHGQEGARVRRTPDLNFFVWAHLLQCHKPFASASYLVTCVRMNDHINSYRTRGDIPCDPQF